MSVATHDFTHLIKSYFSRVFRRFVSTGLPDAFYNCAMRMRLKPSKTSETILLEMSTENGGITHYGSDLITPGGTLYENFLDFTCVLPGTGLTVTAPDGVARFFFSKNQSEDILGAYSKVWWELERIPFVSQGIYKTYDDVDYVAFDNDDPAGSGLATLTFPFCAPTFSDFQVDGLIQVVSPTDAAGTLVSDPVEGSNTMYRKVIQVRDHKTLVLSHPWEVTGTYSCKINYVPPSVQALSSRLIPLGTERVWGGEMLVDPNTGGSTNLVTNGNFAEETAENWELDSEWTYDADNDKLTYDGSGTGTVRQYIADLTPGTIYTVKVTFSGVTDVGCMFFGIGPTVGVACPGVGLLSPTADGEYVGQCIYVSGAPIFWFGEDVNFASYSVTNVELYSQYGFAFTSGDWIYNEAGRALRHPTGKTGAATSVNEVLTTADVGKKFLLTVCVSMPNGWTTGDPEGDDAAVAATAGTLTVAVGPLSFVIGSTSYPLSRMFYQVPFTVDSESDVADAKAKLVMTPSTDFDGWVDGLSLRQIPNYGSLTIDNDAGNGKCRITATKDICDLEFVNSGGATDELIAEGDEIHISNTAGTYDGTYTVETVLSSKVFEISPIPFRGVDATGLTSLVITRSQSSLGQILGKGYFNLE